MSKGGKWSLTDIADQTQLGSPARLATKRRMIQSSSSQGNKDDTVRRLEHQLQEFRSREDLQRRAGELQTQVDDASRRAGELQTQVQSAEDRLRELQTSLAETTQELRQCEDLLTHWVVRREEIELTGPELGVGGWATVTVAKFRGIQVAVKRIHNEIISHHNLQLFQREMSMAARLRHPNLIQFIGATMEGEMMIVMELMATSLRSQLRREMYFPPLLVNAISRDVVRGLTTFTLSSQTPLFIEILAMLMFFLNNFHLVSGELN